MNDAALLHRIDAALLPVTRFAGEDPRFGVRARMEHYRVPAFSYAVAMPDGTISARAHGTIAWPGGPSADVDTLFQAASMSKVVNALLALQLVAEGRIGLDEDVNAKLRSWQVPTNDFTRSRAVTLRRILTHRAGLTVHGFRGYPTGTRLPSVIEVLEGRDGTNKPVFVDIEPDSQQRYSGGGTTVAQLLIEDLTGKPYARVARERVFDPLGLTRTTFDVLSYDASPANVACGHRPDYALVVGGWHRFVQLGAGGLWTTPREFLRVLAEIGAAYRGASRLLPERFARLLLERPYGDARGLGPMVYGHGPSLRFFHDGDNQGYHCGGLYYPNAGYGAVAMTNGDLGTQLWREHLNGVADVCGWPGYLEAPCVPIALAPEALARYAGTYRITAGYEAAQRIAVRLEDGQLVGEIEGLPQYRLTPVSRTDFRNRSSPFTTRFGLAADGRIESLTILEGDDPMITAVRSD